MSGIGIIGIGISGLQLALYLLRQGVDTTLYSAYPMADVAAGPLRYTPTRWAATLDRELSLGLPVDPAGLVESMHVVIEGAAVNLAGRFASPADNTDFRIYLPWLLEAYLSGGGQFRVCECGPGELPALTGRHELVVVAAGREFGGAFPADSQRSPHHLPPRGWVVGFFEGIDLVDGFDMEIRVVPGVGEFFHHRFRSFTDPVSLVGVATLPDGPLRQLHRHGYAEDPTGFTASFLAALRTFAPDVHARVDESRFAPVRPLDLLQGAFVPCVRRAWANVDDRYVMAVGDAWVLNDPIVAQGANLGSCSAFALGAAIAEQAIIGRPYDETFCRRAEAAMWAQAEPPTTFTNSFLAPPPPHVLELFARASHDPDLADRLVSGFGNAEEMLALLAPESASL